MLLVYSMLAICHGWCLASDGRVNPGNFLFCIMLTWQYALTVKTALCMFLSLACYMSFHHNCEGWLLVSSAAILYAYMLAIYAQKWTRVAMIAQEPISVHTILHDVCARCITKRMRTICECLLVTLWSNPIWCC